MGRKRKRAAVGRPVTHTSIKQALTKAAAVLGDDVELPGQPGTKRKSKGGRRANAALIGAFHAAEKQLETARGSGDARKVEEMETLKANLGGMQAYQTASLLGESLRGGYNTARWLVRQLGQLKKRPASGKLELLDVGALGENYTGERSWITVTAIDLHSQDDFVQEVDFFDFVPPENLQFQKTGYDVIALSLCLNFVGDSKKRGEMLYKSCKMLRPGGLLYVVLPRACVENSRYTTVGSIVEIAHLLGLDVVTKHLSTKLAYFLLERGDKFKNPQKIKRKVVRTGDKKNNFFIDFAGK